MKLTNEQIMKVKGLGFLRNRGTDCFSGRAVAPGGVFSAEAFEILSEIASAYGNGKLIPTSRQSVEIPGIPYEKIEEVIAFGAERDIYFGGTGAKVRPITACKGTTCVFGNCDTQRIAKQIHDTYYLGWNAIILPHKFKIGVGGCPNSCMKPSLNDFGIEGHKAPILDPALCKGCKACAIERSCPMHAVSFPDGSPKINRDACIECGVCTGKCPFGAFAKEAPTVYRVFVGGTWGKRMRMGTPLSRYVSEEEILPILEKCMLWFRAFGYKKERFGLAIDRIGIESLEAAIFSDNLLKRKDEILAAPLKER